MSIKINLNQLGCWLLIGAVALSCNKEKEEKEKPTVAAPVKVTVLEVSPSILNKSREYSGTVASSESATASFSIAGTITDLNVAEGQKISKGQLMGKLRSGDYENAYNIAQAQLAEAQDAYNRLKILHDANALPEVKWVEIEQKLKQAENAVQIAKRTLVDVNLISPASGIVTTKFVNVGQTVMPGQPIYQIVSTSSIEMDIPVGENEIGDFFVGRSALIDMETAAIPPFEGKVSQKSIIADPLTRSFTVKISIPNKDGKILPGMTGQVKIDIPNSRDTSSLEVELPSQAVLLNDDNRWFVWVVTDSVAERRFVTAGQPADNGVIVSDGLNPGDKVIVQGMQKVGTGTKVIF